MRPKQKDQNSQSESPTFTNTKIEGTIIGPSISVKGELTGEENLTIQGQVEGRIDVRNSRVTIARTGCIKADVYGKIITIEGEVRGNLFAEEMIVLRQSAMVRGNMKTPRINLKDGAKFKGDIDMDSRDGQKHTLKEVPLAQVQNLSNKR